MTYDAKDWLEVVAKESGLKFQELVETHERKLIEKNLLSARVTTGGKYALTNIELGDNYRLTPLAVQICEFIKEFDSESATGKKKE